MTQYTIKVLNYPDPPAEEAFVAKMARAHERARRWAQAAERDGLEALLPAQDGPMLRALMEAARQRRLVSPEGAESLEAMAGLCAARLAVLAGAETSGDCGEALFLHEMTEALLDLAALVAEALDLRAAIACRKRIAPEEPGQAR